ncbi:MAG: plasmid stabilization protein [Desulfuromonas sp.]|nr:MAG: plasmid stabilization protein [Desulfuromonas sp.]
MAQVVWTEPALDDLDAIAEYIALSNLPSAKKLIQTVFDTVSRLGQHPESGRTPPELEGLNYCEVVVPPCRVFYRVADDEVLILHVMRQEQDMRKFMASLDQE